MALTKTVNEVKELLANFLSNLSDVSKLPDFASAEYKYVVPVTGIALYNDIHNKYNNAPGTLTAEETNILKRMRKLSLCYAFHDNLALNLLKYSDAGTVKPKQANETEIRKWEEEKTQAALLNLAADATEVLLSYLFEITPALWTASDQYKEINALLIKTGTDFSKQYTLFQPMRTYFFIRDKIADAQELNIKDSIGKDLLKYLVEIADPPAGLKSCIDKLKKALAFFSIKKCCEHKTVRFGADGFTVVSDFGSNDSADNFGRKAAEPKDIDAIKNACDLEANNFLNKSIYELVQYNKKEDAAAEYKAAFNAGPLKNYDEPVQDFPDNAGSKLFRF